MEKEIEMPHYITPLVLEMKALKDMGYVYEFEMREEGLMSTDSGKIYTPDEVKIGEHFRFEGISDPEDMSILYTVTTYDGKKGTVVDAFGTYANSNLMDFIKKVSDHTIKNL